jgi:hypothetical protein
VAPGELELIKFTVNGGTHADLFVAENRAVGLGKTLIE